jgi:hypothetical protein
VVPSEHCSKTTLCFELFSRNPYQGEKERRGIGRLVMNTRMNKDHDKNRTRIMLTENIGIAIQDGIKRFRVE